MRLLDRHDGSLAVGLIIGTVIVFHQPLRYVLDVAREVETQYHVDLIPALAVLSVVFVFHQYRKRQQMKAEAVAAAAEARQARERSRDLEQLVAFGQALANALDLPGLRQVLWRHLPKFVQEREAWVLTHNRGQWAALIDETSELERSKLEALEALATQALGVEATSEGVGLEGHVCFPMIVAGKPFGVLGVCEGRQPLSAHERRALGAATALVAITARNVRLFRESQESSLRDGLTGCFNRAHALEVIEAELRRVKRSGRPLSVVMFDIDHFKTINDRYGHLIGDSVLATVGCHLSQILRGSDHKYRYGGDEFLVVLPDTPLDAAKLVTEHLRREIAQLQVSHGEGTLSVTASLGVATTLNGNLDVKALIAQADKALYRAKQAGRNRVCAAETLTVVAVGGSAHLHRAG
ncbi:MAG: hypothetical protein A3J29_22505 [Acidobacteria bacterium RIFCSPLOWO2_12_FULL_67_14b]|nr:MAG: hypothetical protein A3J29_22505 [Acidobacteria bacterium RIFCSPLOWO2_12_FULL_67_14b]